MANRLQEKYTKEIIPTVQKELGLQNVMEVPKVTKVSVNAGIGSFKDSRDAYDAFFQEMANFTNQKPFVRKAKKSEAGFKIRKGETVGLAVTLRGDRMWAFLDKLINVAFPRVRDFRGLKTDAFDQKGNYSIGIREHVIFPEVDPNVVKGMRSLQVTVVMSSKDKNANKVVLEKLGMPFRKDSAGADSR